MPKTTSSRSAERAGRASRAGRRSEAPASHQQARGRGRRGPRLITRPPVPASVDADRALARAARTLAYGKIREAVREYEEIARKHPLNERAACGLGLASVCDGHYHDMLSLARRALLANPGAAYPHGITGTVHEDWYLLDDPLPHYERMLSADPGEVSAYVRKARLLQRDGKEKECAQAISDCLDADWSGRESPREAKRVREMGACADRGRRVEFKALDGAAFIPGLWEALDVAFGPDAGGTDDPDYEGVRLAGRGDLRGCLARADRAIEGDSRSAEPWCIKGDLLAEDGRAAEAVACYDRAVEIDPDMARAHRGKAILLFDGGDREGAAECLRDALYTDPDAEWSPDMRDLCEALDCLESGVGWPRATAERAAAERIRWAAGRRAKTRVEADGAPGGRARFPPGLLDR